MKQFIKLAVMIPLCVGALSLTNSALGTRYMENLGDGVVAVRTGEASVFVSWRLLGLDPSGIGFNLYRSTGGGAAVKLNSSVLTDGTCYADTSADCTQSLEYYVKAVIGGEEQVAGDSYTLPANATVGPYFSVPLQNIGDYYVQHVWVGDLDNDGEYEFVVARLSNTGDTPKLEAYMRNGTFLWRVDMGLNSIVDSDLNDGPVASLSNGHNDHATVYDLDSDGVAEVILKTANGVVFGDGTTLVYGDDQTQFISVLNGMTGAEMARATVPNPYAEDGGLGGHFGIGYFDGVLPTFLFKAKNRNADGGFNLVVTTWDFDGSSLSQRWTWSRDRFTAPPNFHQIRILDVDGDGRDELADGGYVLDDNGTLLYNLADSDIVHGDRFHIGDLDPDNPGLEGWGIQQGSPTGVLEYYYDAADGSMIWQHTTTPPGGDVGRGMVADIDPRYPGYEGWSFSGIYNLPGNTQITQEPDRPWPNFRIWWDGDTLGERLHETKVDKWDYMNSSNIRLLTGYNYEGATDTWRDAPTFYGDIIGDWREEIIFESNTRTQFHIFTTNTPSGVRLYTLAHNPEYRNCMTVKGYLQSNMVDYYLGDGMVTPPVPDIVYVGAGTPPSAPTNLTATAVSNNIIDLSWEENSSDETSFLIERSTDDVNFTQVASVNADVISYSDTGLMAGTTYYYRVRAYNPSGYSGYSNTASDTTLMMTPPDAPTGLTATAGDATVTLDWDDNTEPNLASYNVYRDTTSGGPYNQIATGLTTSDYTDSSVTNGTTYYYVVTAVDTSSNESAYSNEASATPEVPTEITIVGSIAGAEEGGNPAVDSHDGSESTRWANDGQLANAWIEYDLGSVYDIGKVRLLLYRGDSRTYPIRIEIDGVQVFDGSTSLTSGYWETTFATTSGRYVTITMTAANSSGTGWFSIYETEIWEPSGPPIPPDTDPPTPDPMTFAIAPAATGSTSIEMTATTADDQSGVEYYFTCTAGGGNDSGWQDATLYEDTALTPDTQYTYTVTARDKSANQNATAASTGASATTDPQGDVDDTANADLTVAGTVSGSYIDTQATDDVYQSITEIESGGKPTNRHSYLEHKWTINVTGGQTVTFYVEAYQSASSDGDNFVFAYSTDDSAYTDMVTVTKIADDNGYQSCVMPASLSGTVYIRVTDTDQTQGSRGLDTISVDDMFIRSAAPGPPDTDPPTPNPATFAVPPAADSDTAISMTATTGSDATGPVQYYFDETTDNSGGTDSGWQTSPSYTDTGLTASTQYTYTVQMRDSAATPNIGTASTPANATTDDPTPALPWSEGFESSGFIAGGWITTGSPTVSNRAEYSGTYGAKSPATASIETAISTVGFAGIHVKYRRQTKGFDSGENILVEWYDGSGWNPLETVQNADYSDGLQDKTCGIGADNNANFRIRFSTNASSGSEYAYIDEIEVTGS